MVDESLRAQPRIYLREYRNLAAMTQEELAKASGVTQATISLLERDASRKSHASTRRKLATALGISPERLFWPPRIGPESDEGR